MKAYVIEVDQLGQPAKITLTADDYKPDRAQTGYFVGELVRLVRARPLDPVIIRENWKKAYGFLAGDAVHAMNNYAASDPPLKRVDGRGLNRTVAITNILEKSDQTYQVRWQETDYVGGIARRPEQYTGLFQVEIKKPRTESDVFRNPLGVYVVSFSWSKEFTEPVTVAPTTSPLEETREEHINDSEQN